MHDSLSLSCLPTKHGSILGQNLILYKFSCNLAKAQFNNLYQT